MNKLPKKSNDYKNALTVDWRIDEFIKELNKRSIEFSLGVDATSKGNTVSFNIRHRSKDKALLKSLLTSLFGAVKQG